jgi:acyl-CoA reductase-like NAD-dependent aldehyde dehydrogenase
MIQKPSDFKTHLFIDGSYVEAAGGRLETLNPATNDILAEIAAGGAEDIDRAVKAAGEQVFIRPQNLRIYF